MQVGQLIAGKYRVEQTIGRGGMGVVMAALHEQLNQRVALKFLTDNAFQQPEAVQRFVREARAAVQIQSEHVARVMDVGTLENGAPYMVMEYLRGRDLKEVSSRRGPMPVSEAVDYVLQACDAVAEAHSLGIVHRDLKPSNLFLTERPDGTPMVKVLDFGISKALHPGERGSQLQMTASAAIMGSPQYMSPEQIRSSKNVDARADVWALGTILHELLTGNPAYVADTVPGLLAMIVADAPPPLSSQRPDAPPELEAAILRCLQKDREQRFASVAALARALERFASNETKPLVRRIARVLGDDAAPETQLAPLSAVGFTVNEPTGQTNGTWARTGKLRELRLRTPLYARPDVQVGAGVGVLGLGVLVWLLASGSGNGLEGSGLQGSAPQGSAPQADRANVGRATASAAAPAVVAAPIVAALPPAAVPPAALAAPAVTIAGSLRPEAPPSDARPEVRAVVAPNGVRPLLEPTRAGSTRAGAPPGTRAEADQDAESSRKPTGAAGRTGKKVAAASAPAPRTHVSPAPKAPSAPPPTTPAAASPPPKKGDTLNDLFNDTK
ncbi:MAG: serine/threonine-protein kinase [Deltaproteobacteria bacterium]